jgi:hypothetical protein
MNAYKSLHGECTLPFSSDFFLSFHLLSKNLKDQNIIIIIIIIIIISPIILYWCETWSHTTGRMLIEGIWETEQRRILGPMREEVTGGCTGLQNEELHNLYPLPQIVRVIK